MDKRSHTKSQALQQRVTALTSLPRCGRAWRRSQLLAAAVALVGLVPASSAAAAAPTPRGPWTVMVNGGNSRIVIGAVPANAASIPRIEVTHRTGACTGSGENASATFIYVSGGRDNVAIAPGERFDTGSFPVSATFPDGGTVTGTAVVSGTIAPDASITGVARVSWNEYFSQHCANPAGSEEIFLGAFDPAVPRPQEGSTVNVRPTRGTVRIRRRGSRGFVTLGGAAQIPVGSEVDTTRGTVALTSATPGGRTQVSEFYDGRFIARQARGQGGLTELVLSQPLACGASVASDRAHSTVRSRRLSANGTGRFRIRGRYATLTARGTSWQTKDTCTATTAIVQRGTVIVRIITTGQTATASPRSPIEARRRKFF